MEVSVGEYGEDKVEMLTWALQEGKCEPFQVTNVFNIGHQNKHSR